VSGYFGVARLDGKPVDRKLLESIAEQLAFRGPGGTSVWHGERCGGCFTLMRTNSTPQSEQQPVVLDQRYFLWGDLRLDGQADLRPQLGEPKLAASTRETSEELLLRAWNRWGAAALDRLIGDFSLALWDARDSCLVCARDFIGARPLYYSHIGDALYFGNTLNAFRYVPEIPRDLDEKFIADFLIEGFSPDPAVTVFRDIRRLPPGHLLRFSKNGIQLQRFLELPVEDPLEFPHEQDYIEAYLDLLRRAVNDRLPPGAVALYLSGGLDSGSVCAIAAETAGARGQKDKLKAFTFGWQPFFRDPEPQFASLSAQYLGITHHVLTDSELIPFVGVGSPNGQTPEPDQDCFFLRGKKQCQKIAGHSYVVLGGDGGDDVLTGQGWPYLVHLWRRRDWKRIAQDFGGYMWANQRFPPLRAGLRVKIQEFLHPTEKFAGYPRWLNQEFETKLNLRQRWQERENQRRCPEHPLHPQAYQALHEGYWAGVLELEDAGWNGVQLETRAPLLDLRVLRFLLRLPPVPWCVNKELSRRAMSNRLPHKVVRRPKTTLVDDPLQYSSMPAGWPGGLPDADRKRIEMFVNWDKWCETLPGPKGSLSWPCLRPISLAFWLKAVENQSRK